MLLTAGKVPDSDIKVINKPIRHGPDVSEFAETYSDPIERGARFREQFGQTTSWVSFTMMQLTKWLGYWRIRVELNPLYEAYIPPHLRTRRSSLKKLWITVGFDWNSTKWTALVLTQKGLFIVALTR